MDKTLKEIAVGVAVMVAANVIIDKIRDRPRPSLQNMIGRLPSPSRLIRRKSHLHSV